MPDFDLSSFSEDDKLLLRAKPISNLMEIDAFPFQLFQKSNLGAGEDERSFLDYVCYTDYRINFGDDFISMSIDMLLLEKLEISIAGLDSITFEIGRAGYFPFKISVEIRIESFYLNLSNIELGIKFGRDLLIPIQIGQDGVPLKDNKKFVEINGSSKATISTVGSLLLDKDFNISARGFDALNLTPCKLSNVPIALTFQNLKLDLSKKDSIQEIIDVGFDENFQGIYVETLSVYFDGELGDILPTVAASNFIIGTGGVSGTILAEFLPIFSPNTGLFTGNASGMLFGISMGLNKFEMELLRNNLNGFSLEGQICIPFFEKKTPDSQREHVPIGVSISISNDTFLIAASNIPAEIDLFIFKLQISNFSFSFNADGIITSSIQGTITIPDWKDDQGQPKPIDISFEISDDGTTYRISLLHNAPTLNFQGVKIYLDQLVVTFNSSGIIDNDSTIGGRIELPAFQDRDGTPIALEFNLKILNDGFNITVEVPGDDGIEVLHVANIIDIFLKRLILGKSGNNIDFALSGRIVNYVKVPMVEDLLPVELNINKLSYLNNDFSFALDFRWAGGLSVSGDSDTGIRFYIPINKDIGDIFYLDTIQININKTSDRNEIDFILDSARLTLGPVVGVVEGMGLTTTLSKQQGGNLGPVDVGMEFRPPNGFGLSIDAGPVTGGGFIRFDKDRGQYAGMLYLDLLAIEVTAIGILSTKDSNGRDLPPPGFSFLIIITVEKLFIQLGFGFILDGVGGLVGIHRTYSSDALEDGIRQGALDSIMFPDDPLNNMPKIINDVDRVFPAQMDQFVFGPLVQIVWGKPAIFKIEAGIIIKLPPPIIIVILGQLEALLPEADFPIVEIHVDVRGELNFEKKQFRFEVSLRDSRLAFFKMEGDMAFLVDWGSNSNFLLSVGGYHPAFKPPSNFPALNRVGVALNFAGIVQLSVEGYFAISSNSFQFGAHVIIIVGIDEININGWLIFDGLIVFSPFHFTFSFSQGFEVEVGGVSFLGISISGRLSGPSPFRISGEARITILFFDIPIRFDRKFGDEDPKQLPPLDPWPELRDAIQSEESWKASLPPSAYLAGSFRQPAVGAQLMVHPLGIIEMRQKVLPLNLMLDKYREYSIIGQHKFQLRNVSTGEETVEPKETTGDSGELGTFYTSVSDYFAPGQFKDLNDGEKLERSSYELMMAGISIGSNRGAYTIKGDSTSIQERPLQYEEKYIDREEPSQLAEGESREILLTKTYSGAKAYSNLFRSGANKYKERVIRPKTFSMKEETFIVVNTDNLSPYNEFKVGALTGVEVFEWMDDHLQLYPEKRDFIQILSTNELNQPRS